MHIKRYILLVITLLVAAACSTEDLSLAERPHEGPVKVGFWVSDSQSETRTQINEDGHSVSWSPQDKVALWAKDANGAYIFQNQKFNLWFRAANSSKAYFATDLASPMTEGQYTYYACYPYPQSVNGTVATFSIPSTQDGKAAGGADIMVAQGSGEELKMLITPKDPADEESKGDYLVKDGVNLNMRHLVHALRFYVPQAHWGFGDEQIERIVFTMPSNNEGGTISGTVTADVSSGDGGLIMTANGSSTISLNLAQTIGKSMADTSTGEVAYDYAFATIMPGTYQGTLNAKVYSQSKASSVAVSFNGREMKAGHITPVGLNCSNVVDPCILRFVYSGNNLGEDIIAVRINYKDENGNSQVLPITPIEQFAKEGGSYDVDLTDWDVENQFAALRSVLTNQVVTVDYESEHALVSQAVTLPIIAQSGLYEIPLTVPYLFFEDFSRLNGYDFYGGNVSSTRKGSTTINDTFFYSGWTGSQTSGKKGTAIRIRTRNETTWAFYNGRVDSAPISGLKDGASVNVVVEFDYNAVTEESGDDCMSFSYGYTTTQGPIEAYWWYRPLIGSQTGGQHIENAVTLPLSSSSNMTGYGDDVYPDSYYSIKDFTIKSCTNKHRLSWEPLASGATNHLANSKNHWLYLDNIKVRIESE